MEKLDLMQIICAYYICYLYILSKLQIKYGKYFKFAHL